MPYKSDRDGETIDSLTGGSLTHNFGATTVSMPLLSNYTDNAKAVIGGLVNGDVYETNGSLRVVSSSASDPRTAPLFVQVTNTDNSNIAHGDGNPNNGDVPTDASDWGVFDTWTSSSAVNPYSGSFTIGTSSITVATLGYYRVSASVLGSNNATSNARNGLLGRLAKNGTMFGPVASCYIRIGDLLTNDDSNVRSGSLHLTSVVLLSPGDTISVFTARCNTSTDNIQAKAGYSQLLIEQIT